MYFCLGLTWLNGTWNKNGKKSDVCISSTKGPSIKIKKEKILEPHAILDVVTIDIVWQNEALRVESHYKNFGTSVL